MDKNPQNSNDIRHSCAHLLAAAILELWPDTKNTIGPAIENGFYYDFDFSKPITESDLPKIEKKMGDILKTWKSFEKEVVAATEAKKRFKDNPYKLELIDEISKNKQALTIYKSGSFEDLCRGGHSENPQKDIGAFKLLSIAGAYWRGSEKNKMLTRIYGTCFPTQKELDDYLEMQEEAKKRDHKKLGPLLDLFFYHETAPGMAYWLPKGLILYNELLSFSQRIHKEFGYQEVSTPILNKKELYQTSGHWQHYKDDMFVSDMGENEVFGIKPMNCPNAMNIFSLTTRSYKDLPLRYSETSPLHRFELSGTLNGLFRAREFRQDDAHIFLTQDQIKEEFESIMKMIEIFYKTFDLSYRLRFGTRPEKFMGEAVDWDVAEKSLQSVLDNSGKKYEMAEGEGAFYGPKVDILMKDSLDREWQTGTIQLDFQQPKNFKLRYVDDKGAEITPAVIHRAIYGSFERFLGVLIEHYAGKFPIWLSPVQAIVLPISDKNLAYAQIVKQKLEIKDIRVKVDERNETLQAKIRDAAMKKIPYLLIVGGKEEAVESVAVRTREGKDEGVMKIEQFEIKILAEIENKS
jgi:threonyl-tRNA synthetase